MEHVPSIQGSFPLNVPLLDLSPTYGEQPRGFHGFREFPALSGHEIDELGSQGSNTMKTLGMLQSWLFFGLLTEAFGGKPSHLKHAEFVTTCDGGEKKITTRALQKYFFYWRARRWHDERAEVTRHANEVDQCLALASSVVEKFALQHDYLRNNGFFCGSQVDLVLLSIATVGEWVSKARRDAVQFTEANTQNFRPLGWHLPFLNKALKQSGWCIGEREMLMRECNTTCLYYLSTIERSGLGKDHTGCDESGCTALQMRYSEYQPLHVCLQNNRTHCLRQGPRIQQVADILDRGSVPLIRVSSDGKCNLLALDNDDDLEYVAISHVWSEGMGNPKENKLNMCTLQHIQHLVNNLFDPERRPVPFWIDTMCIPPQEHHFTKHKESRKQGIAQMAQIYANASKVLVLDRWLQQVSSKMSLTEIAVRIRHAPWTSRIWTLQEGRLSESLYFQFKDGVVSSAYLDDFVRDQRNLIHVSNLMSSMPNTEVLSNECATWILRAFAYLYEIDPMIKHYGQLGPQQDEAEEELRLQALSILTERAELEPIWNRWGVLIENLGLDKDLGDADEHVHTDICVQRVDLVSEYGANIMSKIKGQGYQHIVRSGNGLNRDQYPSASFLLDVVRSFKDRTTSRKEDEVICLGILLRIKDMSAITEVEPLPWRWRVALKATISSHIPMRCQEIRMKALLSQIEAFTGTSGTYGNAQTSEERGSRSLVNALPQGIVFWNVARVNLLGWRWAPISFLDTSIEVTETQRYGLVTPFGLEVQYSALKLMSTCKETYCATGNVQEAVLVIHTELNDTPNFMQWRQTWQHVRLCPNDKTRHTKIQSPLIHWAKTGLISQMVLLVDRRRGGGTGLIAQQYGSRNDVPIASHVALVERVSQEEVLDINIPKLHVSGRWISPQKWCVG